VLLFSVQFKDCVNVWVYAYRVCMYSSNALVCSCVGFYAQDKMICYIPVDIIAIFYYFNFSLLIEF
jgi:hypothetical protein